MPEIGQKSALNPFELYTSEQDNPIAATGGIGTVGTAAAIGIVRAIRAASDIGITGVIAASESTGSIRATKGIKGAQTRTCIPALYCKQAI